MWTKTTLRLSETNTPAQSFLWNVLNRLVYFAEQSSFNREPRIPVPAGRKICAQYGISGYKTRDGRRTTGKEATPEHPLGWIVVPACCGGKGQYSVSAAGKPGRAGWLDPDWVV